MKSFTLIVLTTLFFAPSIVCAQKYETDKVDQQAISRLEFIVGNWSGTGCIPLRSIPTKNILKKLSIK